MLLVSEILGEVSKLEELLFQLKVPLKKSDHSKPLLKENSKSELLVKMLLDGGIMKPRLSLLLLQPITVKSSLFNSPYLVMSKTVMLPDKKLSKPFFVLLLKLLVELVLLLPIDSVDTVVLLLLPYQPPVLEEEFLPPMPPKPIPLMLLIKQIPLQPNQPLLKFQFMSNHHLLLLLLKLLPLLPNLLLITKLLLLLTPLLLKLNTVLLLPLQLLQLKLKKSLFLSRLTQLSNQLGVVLPCLVLFQVLVTCGVCFKKLVLLLLKKLEDYFLLENLLPIQPTRLTQPTLPKHQPQLLSNLILGPLSEPKLLPNGPLPTLLEEEQLLLKLSKLPSSIHLVSNKVILITGVVKLLL